MIGEKLGKYTIVESVGTGSMGTVYKAEDPADGRPVAIKLVRSNILYDMEMRERFLQGLLTASVTRHPGISPILEIVDEENDFFVITPFLNGQTLAQLLQAQPLDWRFALRVATSICEAVCAVHAVNGIHRALKPSNIWLQSDGSIVVTDCSVARFTEIDKTSRPNNIKVRTDPADTIIPMGALAYMSPEQVRGEIVDYRTDIFSLGVILYEMLTGRHPFEARNSFSRMSAIIEAPPIPLAARKLSLPQPFEAILMRSLAKNAGDRYQSMKELLADLRGIGDDVPSIAASPSAALSGLRRRYPVVIFWIVLLLALGAALYHFMA